jgi:hypothetical protein
MCADCWGVKDEARARRWLAGPPRDSLFAFGRRDPLALLLGLGIAVVVALVAVYALTLWI